MTEPAIAEIALSRLSAQGELRAELESIHRLDWLDQGISRWLKLLDPQGPWPVVVLGARTPVGLAGTIVGVWAPQPIDRFDDLLESACPQPHHGSDRPAGGYWHFIAVTTDPRQRELALGRPLLAAALAFVRQQPMAQMRTLSPAVGLAEALRTLELPGDLRDNCLRVLRSLARVDGGGHLPILGLHPASGATLEKVLWNSRFDEKRSLGITLRFTYDLSPSALESQKAAYRQWLAGRSAAIADGRALPAPLAQRWWVPDCGDLRILPALAGVNDGIIQRF